MSWNRIVLPLLVLLTFSTSVVQAKSLMQISEDELIMRGLLYDEYKAYENSYEVYKKLFDDTGEEVYLFREATASLMSRNHIPESITRLKLWDDKNPGKIEVRRLLIPLYLTIRQVSDAKNKHALAISSGVPPRLSGIASRQPFTVSSGKEPVISVSIKPGAIALQRILREPNSKATDFVKPKIPAFEAA